MRVAILISGRGSNLRSLARACAAADSPARIVLVVSNNPQAQGLDIAAQEGLENIVLNHRDFTNKEGFERDLDSVLTKAGAELICLAGFMRLLSPWFVQSWRDRIINIHPSLLPAFKGLETHRRALEAGVCFTGATVHYVRAEMDDGPILAQAVVPVLPDDTPEHLAQRVLLAEHQLYPHTLRLIAQGKIHLSNDRVKIKGVTWPNTTVIAPALVTTTDSDQK